MYDDFGMYTDKGNNEVGKIVLKAIKDMHTWPWVLKKLEDLGKRKGTEEATDTMVREICFDTMDRAGALPEGQSFWG